MPAGAVVCTECDKHDSRWFEYGKAFLTITSIFSILFSAIVFVTDPVRRIVSAIFFTPNITVESFRTERSARIRNNSWRSIFLTRYEVSIPLQSIDNDKRIPKGQIARTFDLVELEIPPGRSVQLETLSLDAQRATQLSSNGEVTPVLSIGQDEFPYVYQYRNNRSHHAGRILFYSAGDPELLGRVIDKNRLDKMPTGKCGIYFIAEYSNTQHYKQFECHATAGFIGNFDSVIKGYLKWKNAKNDGDH